MLKMAATFCLRVSAIAAGAEVQAVSPSMSDDGAHQSQANPAKRVRGFYIKGRKHHVTSYR
jgi:hypothetical protein